MVEALTRREEVTVDRPMMTVDRQMGLVIVTPEGKVRFDVKLATDGYRKPKPSSNDFRTMRSEIKASFTVSDIFWAISSLTTKAVR